MGQEKVFGRNESLVLNANTFEKIKGSPYQEKMTIKGAVNKTAILLAILAVSAGWGWLFVNFAGGFGALWLCLATLFALVLAVFTTLKMQVAPITAPLYAFLEGSVLGCISAYFNSLYPGIVLQAVLLTFGTLFGLLVVYKVSGFHVTAQFRAGIASATLAILLVYLAEIFLNLIGVGGILYIHQGGLVGIGFSLFVVVIAALNLVLDFDLIERGASQGAPKFMEWYGAFGLMVTLIWLYLEVLKLLVQLYATSDDN